ncbi:MAG: glycosyltransferase family 4 protein [Candidatus Moranbacteria bacterium]|nr:glycosyltransferase family 4 protein [Candidatus Moranbacteria bacterium]
MRVLEVNKFFHERRGAERHFLDVVRLFSDEGHEVAVFSMDHPKNLPTTVPTFLVSRAGFAEGDAGNAWHLLKGVGRLFWSFEGRRVMRQALDTFRPDVVHVHNAYHQLSPSFFPIIRKRRIPIVLTVHDFHVVSPDKDAYHDFFGTSYWKYLLVPDRSFVKKLLLVARAYVDRVMGYYTRYVDAFIVPSVFVKDTLLRAGIPERKIRVIPHFVTRSAISDADVAARPSVVLYALYAGSVSEDKGVRELIERFDAMKYPLILAGRKTMPIPTSEHVRYVGERNRGELDTLYRDASFVVSASRLPETFGLVALEAAAAGKPFIGYDVGALSEVVEQGKTGFLSKNDELFESAIRSCIADPNQFDVPETIQRKTYGRFGKRKYLVSFLDLAKSIIDDTKDHPDDAWFFVCRS